MMESKDQKHCNLYYIFHMDKLEHSLPAKLVQQLWQQILAQSQKD